MTQHELRKSVAFIAHSMGKRLYVPPEQWNLLLPLINYDILKNKYGYPKSPIGAETDQQITDSLLPFKAEDTISFTAGSGNLPSDYFHLMRVKIANAKKVDIVTELEYDERNGNTIIAASTRYPIVILYDGEIRVEPTSITTADIVYLKRPATPVYAYTISNGIITYNSLGSTQFEWGAEHDIDIIRYMLEYLKISLTEDQILAYTQLKKQEEN